MLTKIINGWGSGNINVITQNKIVIIIHYKLCNETRFISLMYNIVCPHGNEYISI